MAITNSFSLHSLMNGFNHHIGHTTLFQHFLKNEIIILSLCKKFFPSTFQVDRFHYFRNKGSVSSQNLFSRFYYKLLSKKSTKENKNEMFLRSKRVIPIFEPCSGIKKHRQITLNFINYFQKEKQVDVGLDLDFDLKILV